MKMKESFQNTFNGLNVNANKNKGYGLYPVILKRIYDQLNVLQEHHSRITIVRIDLHFPLNHKTDNKSEDQLISRFLKMCKSDLGSLGWGQRKRFIHGWVKEIGEVEKSHYHLFLGFQTLQRLLGKISSDGHTGMWKLFGDRWSELTGGTVHFVKNPHFLNRDDKQKFADCFYHLSYLAKIRDKHFGTGETHRRFGFSKLAPKQPEPIGLEEFMTA